MGLENDSKKESQGGFLGDFQIPNMGDRWIMALLPELRRDELLRGS